MQVIMYLLLPTGSPLPGGILHILGRYSPRVESCAGRGYFLDFTGEPALEQVLFALARDLGKLLPGKLWGGLGSSKLLSRIITESGLESAQPKLQHLAGKLTLRPVTPRFQLWQLPDYHQAAFLQELPISFLWPCPPKILTAVYRLGIRTTGQLAQVPLDLLVSRFGHWGTLLQQYCRGTDSQTVKPLQTAREITYRRFFPEPVISNQVWEAALAEGAKLLAQELALRNEGCLSLKIHIYLGSSVLTLERKFSEPQHSWTSLRDNVLALTRGRAMLSAPLKGMLVVADEFKPVRSRQLTLFEHPQLITGEKKGGPDQVAKVVASLEKRYQKGVVKLGNELKVSRRELMLQLVDPLRLARTATGRKQDGQVC
ncbi:MAG TPA: hypothetical protein VHS59_06440 [Bacillota bacterium]|nr:hypothetical protein [Bacillota bacterium]